MPPPVIAAGIIGASVLGASAISRRSTGAERAAAGAAQTQADIARSIFEETAPVRGESLASLSDILRGGTPPVFGPAFETIQSQFGRARESVLSSTPARGGQLNEMLAGIEMQRAGTIGGLQAALSGEALQQGLTAGQVGAQQAGAGFGQAAAGFMGIAQQAAARQAAAGQAAGTLAALGKGGLPSGGAKNTGAGLSANQFRAPAFAAAPGL